MKNKEWKRFFIIYGAMLFIAVVIYCIRCKESETNFFWEHVVAVTSMIMVVGGLEDERED